jgi:hypothetical protein
MSERGAYKDNIMGVTIHMKQVIQEFVTKYQWIHTGLGLMGNFSFFIGSVFFLWDSTQIIGVWLFIIGSAGMLFGSLGDMFVLVEEKD